MPSYCRLAILLVIANILWASPSLASVADRIYSVQRVTSLRLDNDASKKDSDSQSTLRRGTLIRVISDPLIDSTGEESLRVITLEEYPRSGWVDADTVIPIDTWIHLLNTKARSIKNDDNVQSIPQLIRTQSNPDIRQAWKEAAEAFKKNAKRPEDQRLPEPYFARAEIWTAVNNYVAAIENYVDGLHYARSSGRDIITYAPYFEKMQAATEKLLALPVPAVGTEKSFSVKGFHHFNRGISFYLRGNYQAAINNFDDAISLAPAEPLCWYFRALAYYGTGDLDRAQHDALLGAHFERKLTRHRRQSLNRSLARVQGTNRMWLEGFRLGSPNGHGLQKTTSNLVVKDN